MNSTQEEPPAKRGKSFPSVDVNINFNSFKHLQSPTFEQCQFTTTVNTSEIANFVPNISLQPSALTTTSTSNSSSNVTNDLNNLNLSSETQSNSKQVTTNLFFIDGYINKKLEHGRPKEAIPRAMEHFKNHDFIDLYNSFKLLRPNEIDEIALTNIRRFIVHIHSNYEVLAKEKLNQNDAIIPPVENMEVNVSKPSNGGDVTPADVSPAPPVSSVAKIPKWIYPEKSCQEMYESSNKEITNFLIIFIPQLYEMFELLSTNSSSSKTAKKEEAEAVVSHFWKNNQDLNISLLIEKECSNQRRKIATKIYTALNNCKGVIMSKSNNIFQCKKSKTTNQLVPKSGKFIEFKNCEWNIPAELQNENYVIVSKKDATGQTIISKVELFGLTTTPKITELAKKKMMKKK
uniref:Uncharacterized protein n=1 Tax=Panagrolaimus sp. ES5 TaxID=591445 RepID=A0AC34FE42_9BILA